MRACRVLVVDDEEGVRRYCQEALRRLGGYEVGTEGSSRRAVERIAEEEFDLLLTDLKMPQLNGLELVQAVQAAMPELPIVIMTGHPSVDTAVACLRAGATDYLTKPFLPEDLIQTVKRAIDTRRLRDENSVLRRQLEKPHQFDEFVGTSRAMQAVFQTLRQVASSDVDVLVTGETGTGKELVARSIHRHSRRAEKPFVPVDCGAIPDALLESELFGHERGAFTGAESRSIGLMEVADRGTFFLDEVGELPLSLQAKLLRALQERQIRRVGGKEWIDCNVRVVAATARDLQQACQQQRFRDDLYFRINVVTIRLPPLRERVEDVPQLSRHFLERFRRDGSQPIREISDQALEVLQTYRWPGNVRELQNVIRRGIALSTDEVLDVDDLPEHIVVQSGEHRRHGDGFFALRDQRLQAFEREYLTSTLQLCAGDVAAAARLADLPLGTYYRLLKKHGLKAAQFREG